MDRSMHIFLSDISTPSMVGLLAAYSYLQQAAEGLPANVFELLLGNVGTLVLSLIVGYWLYRANQHQRERIERMQAAALEERDRRIQFLETENARLWQEHHAK